jgi:nucleoside-diphosphate-sugar epimerase
VDQKKPRFEETDCQDFLVGDLTDPLVCAEAFDTYFDEVYQLAADMGGAGYIFTGENDADVMYNSALINLNVANAAYRRNIKRVFYSSSACMYPEHNQLDPENPKCNEDSAYPADPDSEYGWEKLFSERLFLAFGRNKGMEPRVARYHNIFGPLGSWNDGREKAPAALCRKVAEVETGGVIDIWGDGLQTRSFLYIDDCIEATKRLTRSDWEGPVNIGSEEMIAINDLAYLIASIADKKIEINNISGPVGVRGRNSDNDLIKQKLSWSPEFDLRLGLEKTYPWILSQVFSNE